MNELLNLVATITFVLAITFLPIMILTQVFLSIFMTLKIIRIYKEYKKVIDRDILQKEDAWMLDFLLHFRLSGLIYKSFSRQKYETTFKKFFRFNEIKDQGLKRELESYFKISRIQMMLAIILIVSFTVFFILIMSIISFGV